MTCHVELSAALAELLFAIEAAVPWLDCVPVSSGGSRVALKEILARYDWDNERWAWITGVKRGLTSTGPFALPVAADVPSASRVPSPAPSEERNSHIHVETRFADGTVVIEDHKLDTQPGMWTSFVYGPASGATETSPAPCTCCQPKPASPPPAPPPEPPPTTHEKDGRLLSP